MAKGAIWLCWRLEKGFFFNWDTSETWPWHSLNMDDKNLSILEKEEEEEEIIDLLP